MGGGAGQVHSLQPILSGLCASSALRQITSSSRIGVWGLLSSVCPVVVVDVVVSCLMSLWGKRPLESPGTGMGAWCRFPTGCIGCIAIVVGRRDLGGGWLLAVLIAAWLRPAVLCAFGPRPGTPTGLMVSNDACLDLPLGSSRAERSLVVAGHLFLCALCAPRVCAITGVGGCFSVGSRFLSPGVVRDLAVVCCVWCCCCCCC